MGRAMVGAIPLNTTSPSSSCGVLSSPMKEVTCWARSGLSLSSPLAMAERRSWPRPSSSRSTQWGCRWCASAGGTPWKDLGCSGELSLSAKANADIQRTHWAMSCHLYPEKARKLLSDTVLKHFCDLTWHGQGDGLGLGVVEGWGSEDTVVELEAADVHHAEVHQLHGAREREAGVGG